MDEFLWIDESRLINLREVAYVEMGDGQADIYFSNGDQISIEGPEFEAFKSHLTRLHLNSTRAPKSTPGFKN